MLLLLRVGLGYVRLCFSRPNTPQRSRLSNGGITVTPSSLDIAHYLHSLLLILNAR